MCSTHLASSPFAECCLQSLWSLWWDAHLCKICRPIFKCSPYLQLWNHSLFSCFLQWTEQLLFRPKFNPSFLTVDHNDLKVFGIWLLFFFLVFFFFLFWSETDILRIVIFPLGSQRKNPILLKISWRMIATFTFYCSAPQQKNIWNLFNHISSHTKAIKSTLQIIYDSTQCNIIHNTILIISEKEWNSTAYQIFLTWRNKDWISFHPALVSVRLN